MTTASFLRQKNKPSCPVRGGFTLVELLLCMGIIAILASVTIAAINPAKQMGDARNTQRKFDVNTILNAYGQYSIDNGGYFTPNIVDGSDVPAICKPDATEKQLCKPTATLAQCESLECVWTRHLTGTYIASVPMDPHDLETSGDNENLKIDYYLTSLSPGRLRVTAPRVEGEGEIGAVR